MIEQRDKSKRYLRWAAANEGRAASTYNEEFKTLFLQIAAQYRDLAEQIDDPERSRLETRRRVEMFGHLKEHSGAFDPDDIRILVAAFEKGGTAMTGYPPRKPKSARRVAFSKWAFVGAIAGAALISACSQPSDSQQTAEQHQPADEQARKDADEKAWADAEKTNTAAAYTAYLQNFGAGAHVSEASQRIVALNEAARKAADEKAWADAEKAGTAAAYTAYTQNFGGGAHVAEARQRVAELGRKEADDKAWADAVRTGTAAAPTPHTRNVSSGARVAEARERGDGVETRGRKEVPAIDIQNTCKLAAAAMVSLMGGTTTEQDINACLDSEQKARDQIVKDRATYSSADKVVCMRTGVYLPSYVEWLTCLEMERDVRKMQREDQFGAGPYTLPRVSPAINPAGRQSQRGRGRASSRRKGSGLEIY